MGGLRNCIVDNFDIFFFRQYDHAPDKKEKSPVLRLQFFFAIVSFRHRDEPWNSTVWPAHIYYTYKYPGNFPFF